MRKFIALCLVFLCLINICWTGTSHEQQMSLQEIQNAKRLIEQQLAAYENPWRWYQIVGIGIAILIGFQCVRCCFPICLGCGMFCCTALFVYIQSLFIKNDYHNNQEPNPPEPTQEQKILYRKTLEYFFGNTNPNQFDQNLTQNPHENLHNQQPQCQYPDLNTQSKQSCPQNQKEKEKEQ